MPNDPEIHIDEAALQRAIQPGIEQMEREFNATLQDTIRAVRDEMQGQPAEDVYNELVVRLRAALPDFELDDDAVKELAAEIEAGTLED